MTEYHIDGFRFDLATSHDLDTINEIYREAKKMEVVGSVKNTGKGVEIISNNKNIIKIFDNIPPLAEIPTVETNVTLTPPTL